MSEAASVESTTRARAEALVDELVANGDLDNLVHLARLIGSAQDALTDDMVTRLAGTVAGGLDMLDQANRSGIARALPAIGQLVENGDLDRIVNLARLAGSAEDALTDDMVTRLAGAMSGGLDMLDKADRSGVVKALPAIGQLVENGDLDRIVNLARLVGSAEDALTDDMISRLAFVASEGLFLVDRLTRSAGFMRMIAILEREDIQDTLTELLQAVSKAREDARTAPAARGGLGSAMKVVADPDTQSALHLLTNISRNLTGK